MNKKTSLKPALKLTRPLRAESRTASVSSR